MSLRRPETPVEPALSRTVSFAENVPAVPDERPASSGRPLSRARTPPGGGGGGPRTTTPPTLRSRPSSSGALPGKDGGGTRHSSKANQSEEVGEDWCGGLDDGEISPLAMSAIASLSATSSKGLCRKSAGPVFHRETVVTDEQQGRADRMMERRRTNRADPQMCHVNAGRKSVQTSSVFDNSGALSYFILQNRAFLQQNSTWESAEQMEKIDRVLADIDAANGRATGPDSHVAMVICMDVCKTMIADLIFKSSTSPMKGRMDFKRLRQKADEIRAWKRDQACLRAEVDNWLISFKLLHNKALSMHESVWERKKRHEDFWTHFHSRRETELTQERSQSPQRRYGMLPPSSPNLMSSSQETLLPPPRKVATAARLGAATASSPSAASNGRKPVDGARTGSQGGPAVVSPALEVPRTSDIKWRQGQSSARAAMGLKQTASSAAPLRRRRGKMSRSGKGTSLPRLPFAQMFDADGNLNSADAVPQRKALAASCSLPSVRDHQRRYLAECDNHKRMPIPLQYVTGHSKKLDLVGRDLVDEELVTMAGMLNETEVLEVADLACNSLLTDVGLVPFLRQLMGAPLCHSLQQLSLANCIHVGPRTTDCVINLLGYAYNLRVLDISRAPVATRQQSQLCQALGSHAGLESVVLAEIGLHSTYVAKLCCEGLLSSATIKHLDLSWNCFSSEAFQCLGEQTALSLTLRSLHLANCSGAAEESGDPPISFFLERLSDNKTLQRLDVSLNRIDHECFHILEDAVDAHTKLLELAVCDNPLGVWGVRSAMRLLSRSTNFLKTIRLEGCFEGSRARVADEKAVNFRAAFPGGKYLLDLGRAPCRSLLRLLYRFVDRIGIPVDAALQTISFVAAPGGQASKNFAHPAKDSHGARAIPTSGLLRIELCLSRCIDKISAGIDDNDGEGFLAKYLDLVRHQFSFKKAIPMLANWKLLRGTSDYTQGEFLCALTEDFCLSPPHLANMCEGHRLRAKSVLWSLGPSLPYSSAAKFVGSMVASSLHDFVWIHQKSKELNRFNANNPTGHYKLNLSSPSDTAVAHRLRVLDRWEICIDERCQFFDASMWANRSHFRNETLDSQPMMSPGDLCPSSINEIPFPESGLLEFDYVTTRRRPSSAAPVKEDLWSQIMLVLYDSSLISEYQVAVLRSMSDQLAVKSMQLRKLLSYFGEESVRVDVIVMMFFRVVDRWNDKVFRSRFHKEEDMVRMRQRLGYAAFFPYFQPEHSSFDLDFAHYEQRLTGNLLINLAHKEKIHNLREYRFYQPDGTEVAMPTGVPLAWQALDKIPKEGRFLCSYSCAPQDRNFELRRQFADRYGHYTSSGISASEVTWWTALHQVPNYIIRLLAHFMWKFENAHEAFLSIDGVNGNGAITLTELDEYFTNDGYFTDLDAAERKNAVQTIFRYLDYSTLGSIDQENWKILDQLWKEFELSTREFLKFMVGAFGEDLETIWQLLVGGSTEELSIGQWMAAVEDVGYFGPAHLVYALLDYSGDGSVSVDEFWALEKYFDDIS